MRVTYDANTDCGYIDLAGPDARSKRVVVAKIAADGIFGELVVDVGEDGHIIGIEILGVTTIMPALIRLALKEPEMNDTPSEPAQRPRKQLMTPMGLGIEFKHEHGSWPMQINKRGKKVEIVVTRRTLCRLRQGPDGPVVSTGEAYCSPSDNFEYELGRQHALFEVTRRMPRKTRIDVIRTYLEREGAQQWRLDGTGRDKTVGSMLLMDDDGRITTAQKLSIEGRMKIAEAIWRLASELAEPATAEKKFTLRAVTDLVSILAVP